MLYFPAIENRHASSETDIAIKVERNSPGVFNGAHKCQKIADRGPPSSTEIGPPLSMAEEGLNLYTRAGVVGEYYLGGGVNRTHGFCTFSSL
jgi:hypothetical protein